MKKVLKILLITQHNEIEGTSRLNPYNPLSYLTLVLAFLFVLIMSIIESTIETVKEIDYGYNPFKWRH